MKFVHTTLHVSDLARSEAFYEDVVGLKAVRRIAHHIVFLADEASSTQLELIADPEAVCPSEGVAIGFYCEKVDAYHVKLESEGLDVSNVITPSSDTRFFFVKDPDGYTVQFID